MSTKTIATIILFAFTFLLLVGVYYIQTNGIPGAQKENDETVQTPEPSGKTPTKTANGTKVDRIQIIEEALSELKKNQDYTDDLIIDLSEKVNNLSTGSASLAHKSIIDIKQTQGSVFTTTSNAYTPMSTFVNITCPQKCTLWINYYTSSKNDSSNNVNTYGVFVDGQDKGIYSQGNITNANGAVPIALNASLPVSAGSYTVEIKAKTSGGTLQSDVSFLQVMAIEQ